MSHSQLIVLCRNRRIATAIFFVGIFLLLMSYSAHADTKRIVTSKITQPIEHAGFLYYPQSFKSLSSLLWRFKQHDVSDIKAVSQYIIMNDCDIYAPYVQNDFAWARIVESKKRELDYFSNKINRRFVFSDIIELSRFDFRNNVFHLDSRSRMANMGLMTLADRHNFDLDECAKGYSKQLSRYPKGLTLRLENPFSLESFPIDPSGAESLIDEFIETRNKKRVMFSRLFVRISGIDKISLDRGFRNSIQFAGRLERFEIYNDIEAKNLIYSKDF